MKKIINDPKNFVKEYVEGLIAAHSDQIELLNDDFRMITRKDNPKKDKVGIVTAGGSGHLPLFLGYVGEGLLDGCAVGNVFASPSSEKMFELIKDCDYGKGVLCLYGNYGGDVMNFAMAKDLAEFEDIEVVEVKGKDDIASAPESKKEIRRGVAGLVYGYKIAGAAADEGYELEKVKRITEEALNNIRSMGVALSPCIVPEVGKPTFRIEDDEITADEIAELISEKINSELLFKEGNEVSVMINGLGATPLEEQYIVFRKIAQLLKEKGVTIIQPHIGEFATSMEMAGLSVTIFKLTEELKTLLLKTAKTPFYTNFNK